jgi:hypothetical protein
MKKVGSIFFVECEWDIGQEYQVFPTYEDAEHFLQDHFDDWEQYGYEEPQELSDLMDDGMVFIKEVKIMARGNE